MEIKDEIKKFREFTGLDVNLFARKIKHAAAGSGQRQIESGKKKPSVIYIDKLVNFAREMAYGIDEAVCEAYVKSKIEGKLSFIEKYHLPRTQYFHLMKPRIAEPTNAGEVMLFIREKFGMSQHDFARVIGQCKQSICNVERGHSPPSPSMILELRKICKGTNYFGDDKVDLMLAAQIASKKSRFKKRPSIDEI